MPTDPSDPSSSKPSTRLYQTTSDAPKGGGGGIFFVILLVLLLGGGGAYYFLVYKPAAAAGGTVLAPPPTASSAAPTPKTPPKVDTSGNGNYTNAQRTQYIKQAEESFIALRDTKLVPYTTAVDAMLAAGGLTAVGLTSKEAIAARRELVAKCVAANDDYEAFTKTQDETFKAELQKTPLIPNDVDYVLSDYTFKAQTDKNVQVRDLQRDSLKTGDEMLAYLDKTYGGWSLNAAQHLTFKKPGEGAQFSALAKSYNDQVAAINKLLAEIKAIVSPTAPVPGTSPAASAASPGAIPAGTAATVSPTVAPAATPVASAAP